MKHIVERLESESTVSFRPKGNSMTPLIKSGQLVTLRRVYEFETLTSSDIVLCKVKGRILLHKIIGGRNENHSTRYLIGNNHGHVNGWASKIYAVLVKVED